MFEYHRPWHKMTESILYLPLWHIWINSVSSFMTHMNQFCIFLYDTYESILYLPLWHIWITRVAGHAKRNALEDLKLRDWKEEDHCEWLLDSSEAENEGGMKVEDILRNGAARNGKGPRPTITSTEKHEPVSEANSRCISECQRN